MIADGKQVGRGAGFPAGLSVGIGWILLLIILLRHHFSETIIEDRPDYLRAYADEQSPSVASTSNKEYPCYLHLVRSTFKGNMMRSNPLLWKHILCRIVNNASALVRQQSPERNAGLWLYELSCPPRQTVHYAP